MNFFGLHTYPEGRPNAEPTVWIGPPDEVGEGTEVKAAYLSSYFTTLRGNWGYEVKPTGDYAHGAGWLFHRGGYGNDTMEDLAPQPWNAEDARTLFARAADVLKDAFTFARRLGTKAAAGTETPLVVPKALGERLAKAGRKAEDLETTQGPQAVEGPIGGYPFVRAAATIAGTADPAVYRDQRCGLTGYRVRVPKGRYAVTLRFAEMERTRVGERVFDITLEGRPNAAGVDLAKSPGARTAFDSVARDVAVSDGWLDVGFVDHHNVACLAAIEVEGGAVKRRINVGGAAVAGYEADLPGLPFVPTGDFWRAWAEAEVGPEAGPKAAALFEKLDSRLPQPAAWIEGPGGLDPDERPWAEAKADYAFVDELAALRPLVRGPASLERFDYWLETFRYMRAMGELRCASARLRTAVAALRSAPTAGDGRRKAEAALEPLRAMVPLAARVMEHLYGTVSTRGEQGTVANWQQHVLPRIFEQPAREIEQALGSELPADARLGRTYVGPERLVVPTDRTALETGEPLRLEAIVLGGAPAKSVQLAWRPMGAGAWTTVPFVPAGRGVWRVSVPSPGGDFEYAVEAVSSAGTPLRIPVAGRDLARTVVVLPSS